MFYLKPPRHISTLPIASVSPSARRFRSTSNNRHRHTGPAGPFRADIVAKVFLGRRTKILRTADALFAWRREGPYRFIQNRSWTSVVALKSDAAAEKSQDRLSRDF